MKNIFYFITIAVLAVACSPEEYSAPANLTADDVDWGITETGVLNEYLLVNNTKGVSSKWDLGNGVTVDGDSAIAQYTFAGDYTVSLTVISQGGQTIVNETISTDKDNPAFLSGYPYDELVGVTGEQTWAVDAYSKAHFGLGEFLENPIGWYEAGIYEKEERGLYDDRFTFSITESGLTMIQETNGDVYANGSWAADLGPTDGNEEPDGSDFVMPYDGGSHVVLSAGSKLIVQNQGFIGYYAGASEYEIKLLEDDLLEIAFYDSKGNFWWFTRLRPVDKLTTEPEPVIKEVKAQDILDDFEGNGNILWGTADIQRFETIPNFAQVPVNVSENIAAYEKGAGEWTNLATELDFIMDLSERNVFTMKVFIPNFNDYETQCNPGTDWLSEHNLKPQVDVKLHNSLLGGNAWETQEVRSHIIATKDLGKWIELEFDFSDVTDRIDFDKIVIQLGAEGHCNEGLFYIDDFMLL